MDLLHTSTNFFLIISPLYELLGKLSKFLKLKPISFNTTFSSRIILSENSDYCLRTQNSKSESNQSVKFLEKYDHIDAKLSICRRLMRVLFAKTDAPLQFAKQIGWQECICRCVPFYSSQWGKFLYKGAYFI